jgi:hypothetical protein
MPKDPDKIVEQLPNDAGVTPRDLLHGCFMGGLPANMCEEPYLLTAEIDAIEPTSVSEAALRGMFSYATNPTLCYQIEFTGTVNFASGELSIAEKRAKPEEEFTYSGRLSANGRVIHLRAYQSDGFESEPFYLIHEASIEHLMQLDGA